MTPHSLSADEVLNTLESDRTRGLSETGASARLARYGRNELTAAAIVPAWRQFLEQFRNPLVILLLLATGISASLWLYERDTSLPYEALVIFSVVLLNASMGYLQESRAERAVLALRSMSAAQAHVLRDGVRRSVPAAEVVPGDIVFIEEGDTAPADARLIELSALQMAEAALTGESMPVSKELASLPEDAGLGDRHDMVFSGTAATYGRGMAVVVATGMQTQMGLIAGALADTPSEATPLQRELARVGKLLGLLVVAIAVVMIATILAVEDVHGFSALFDVLMLGVALAVAAVPEGLPAVVTAVLSIGVQRMAKRNAIVRHLAAVETLGSASVIASDKTGTLTKNEMTVRVVVTASGGVRFAGTGYAARGCGHPRRRRADRRPVARGAGSCAHDRRSRQQRQLQEQDGRWTVQGDPTEGALIVAARKAKLESVASSKLGTSASARCRSPRSASGCRRYNVDREQEHLIVFTKGAPDVLLARCMSELVGSEERPLTAARRAEIWSANDALAEEALRTLARRVSAASKDGSRPCCRRSAARARAGLRGVDRHHRPPARRGPRGRRACSSRWHPADHDHGRSSGSQLR